MRDLSAHLRRQYGANLVLAVRQDDAKANARWLLDVLGCHNLKATATAHVAFASLEEESRAVRKLTVPHGVRAVAAGDRKLAGRWAKISFQLAEFLKRNFAAILHKLHKL